ncbi:MAG TPA: non-homologous end-joining DNA ligase [Syntrophales bacterium]|nr:non-homologous end-joining DNA ligase [Syntrophales bacterium]
MSERIRAGARVIDITKRDKVLFPDDDIRKGDLIDYYSWIAPSILPYLRGRPLMMQRFPDGIASEGFYQKNISDYFPGWIRHIRLEKEGGELDHLICENRATLIYVANQACISLHTWLSRADRLHYPDQMIFDLDPTEGRFRDACRAARLLGDLLREISLESLVKTTGSAGLHVLVPIDRKSAFDEVRSFAHDAAACLCIREPSLVTAEIRKIKRRGRVYIDTLRNAYGQTAVAPYSVRPRPGAPVSAPLFWEELDDPGLSAVKFTLKNLRARIEGEGDPWQAARGKRFSLGAARRRLSSLR